MLNRKLAYSFLNDIRPVKGADHPPSVTSMGPTLPDPGKPDLPSTPSYSSMKVIPTGSGCDIIVSSHAFFDVLVKNLTCSGHMLYGCAATIVFATLKRAGERVRQQHTGIMLKGSHIQHILLEVSAFTRK